MAKENKPNEAKSDEQFVFVTSFWVGKKYYQSPKPASSVRDAIPGLVTREQLGDEEFAARTASGHIKQIENPEAGQGGGE